jgi:hypothetical protein
MKIEIEGALIKMSPETDEERAAINKVWTLVIDCVKDGKKLVPVGEYIPGIKETATFHIE